jgi:hypothetical protein
MGVATKLENKCVLLAMRTSFCVVVLMPHAVKTYGKAVSRHHTGVSGQVHIPVTLLRQRLVSWVILTGCLGAVE